MGPSLKLNIPSEVPSETCPSETLEGDVLGVVIFGFVGWGPLTFGGEMGEFCNCGGDDSGGICCYSNKGGETKGVSVIGVSIIGVSLMGFSMIGLVKDDFGCGSGIGLETLD